MLEKQDTIERAHLAVERAADELRRQRGLVVRMDGALMAVCPLEFVDAPDLAALRSLPGRLQLLLTGTRARSAGLNCKAASALVEAADMGLESLRALADPLAGAHPTGASAGDGSELEPMLALAKYAALLPALLVVRGDLALAEHEPLPAWQRLDMADLRRAIASPPHDIVQTAAAMLPVEGAEQARIVSFRQRHGTSVHLALVIGEPQAEDAPLVRVHSSCVTGDILGSLRCDCGDQLQMALAQITREKSGVLVYLHQEGRGIGITNKLRAYRLQEQGFDTYDANAMLGFDEDERDFAIAAAILKALGFRRIRLLTNNPQKIAALEKSGIVIAGREPLVARSGRHNHAYLSAKAKKSGHLF